MQLYQLELIFFRPRLRLPVPVFELMLLPMPFTLKPKLPEVTSIASFLPPVLMR